MTTPKTPEGWQLVPTVPTQAMCQAMQDSLREWPKFPFRVSPAYQVALSAAPAAPSAEGVGSEGVAPADLRAPATLPESMRRDEMLKYYSEYANMVAHEVIGYQRQIRELKAVPAAPTAPAGGEALVAYIRSDHLQKARRAAFLCHVQPEAQTGFTPLYTHPSADLRGAAEQALEALQSAISYLDGNFYLVGPSDALALKPKVRAAIASLEAAISRKGKTE